MFLKEISYNLYYQLKAHSMKAKDRYIIIVKWRNFIGKPSLVQTNNDDFDLYIL